MMRFELHEWELYSAIPDRQLFGKNSILKDPCACEPISAQQVRYAVLATNSNLSMLRTPL